MRRPPQGDPRRGRSARGRQGRAPPRARACRTRAKARRDRCDDGRGRGEAARGGACRVQAALRPRRRERRRSARVVVLARARIAGGPLAATRAAGRGRAEAHSGGAGRGGLQRPRRAALHPRVVDGRRGGHDGGTTREAGGCPRHGRSTLYGGWRWRRRRRAWVEGWCGAAGGGAAWRAATRLLRPAGGVRPPRAGGRPPAAARGGALTRQTAVRGPRRDDGGARGSRAALHRSCARGLGDGVPRFRSRLAPARPCLAPRECRTRQHRH